MSRTARSRRTTSLLSAALALLAVSARAEFIAQGRPRALALDLMVEDESGAREALREVTAGSPALLLPVFMRCTGTCPVTTEALKSAAPASHAPFRVVVFSFDAQDTARDLKDFRQGHELPKDWRIVRAADAGAARAFLDQLGFAVMKTEGGFAHPDQTFVLSPRGAWAGTFNGGTFGRAELELAYDRALKADAAGWSAFFASLEGRIVLAGLCLAFALAWLFARAVRR